MTEGPFRGRGDDGEEPEGSCPLPAGGNGSHDVGQGSGNDRDAGGPGGPPEDGCGEEMPPDEGAEQGLFWCVPAGNADLSGFTGDGEAAAIAPGPLLAGLTAAVAGSDGAGLAGTSEDFLFGVMSAGRRMSSWGTWLELAAMNELALRPPATPDRPARRNQPGPGPADASPASARHATAGPPGS